MRYVTNGNIYAPTMMLAEKSADLILGNTPLPPLNEPFYIHHAEDGSAVVDGRSSGSASEAAPAEAASASASGAGSGSASEEAPTADV
jgi:hypothetical protein